MTGNMSQDDKLFEEAFDLIIMLQAGKDTPQVRDLIQVWRARGPAHEAAWREAMHIHSLSGDLLHVSPSTVVPLPSRPGLSRRRFLLGATAVAAAGALLAVAGPQLLLNLRADNVTATAEVKHLRLEDGTAIALGPDSAVRYHFTPQERRIELLSGMAWIDVAADDMRTFRAVARDMQVSTFDSAFDLSQESSLLNVSVGRGSAEVLIAGNSDPVSPQLGAGDWLTLDLHSQLIEHGHHSADAAGAWQDGTLVVDGETLSSVVARIARWQPGKVVMASSRLGHQRISGVYNLSDPLSALQAAVQPRGGKVHELSPWLTVIATT